MKDCSKIAKEIVDSFDKYFEMKNKYREKNTYRESVCLSDLRFLDFGGHDTVWSLTSPDDALNEFIMTEDFDYFARKFLESKGYTITKSSQYGC